VSYCHQPPRGKIRYDVLTGGLNSGASAWNYGQQDANNFILSITQQPQVIMSIISPTYPKAWSCEGFGNKNTSAGAELTSTTETSQACAAPPSSLTPGRSGGAPCTRGGGGRGFTLTLILTRTLCAHGPKRGRGQRPY